MNLQPEMDSLPGTPAQEKPINDPMSDSTLSILFRRFFSCNPLYLASAGLLLYGINRLSSDPALAGAESAQITFNFAALFLYEILLVWTAIVLARRAIWYDSLLLVGLENLFVLIPFSLVSRAVQLNEPLARKMCLAAVLLAVLKFWALKRYIPRVNLPARLLAFGGVAMLANVALALGLRRIFDDATALNSWITFGWVFGLPALVALGNFLPKCTRPAESPEEHSWLPNAALAIWIAVTAGHLGGVGYVYSFKWGTVMLAPTLWAVAWTMRLQIVSRVAYASAALTHALNVGPLVATMLATDDSQVFFALNLLNALGFACLWWRVRTKANVTMILFSLAMSLAGMPEGWATWLVPGFDRAEWALCGFAVCLLGLIIASRSPRWTIVGGMACFAVTGIIAKHAGISLHWAVQAGMAFAVAHSLRWRDAEIVGARAARMMICVAWVAQSLLWTQAGGRDAMIGCCIFGGAVLGIYILDRIVGGVWATRTVPISAVAILLSPPGAQLVEKLKATSPGYLAVAGSFLLFGLGTIAAFARKRWARNGQF